MSCLAPCCASAPLFGDVAGTEPPSRDTTATDPGSLTTASSPHMNNQRCRVARPVRSRTFLRPDHHPIQALGRVEASSKKQAHGAPDRE
jgi:hypothetical protein